MTIGPWDRRQPQGQKILHKSSAEKTTSKSEIYKKGSGSSVNKKNKSVEKESGSSVNKKRGRDVRWRRVSVGEKKESAAKQSNELMCQCVRVTAL